MEKKKEGEAAQCHIHKKKRSESYPPSRLKKKKKSQVTKQARSHSDTARITGHISHVIQLQPLISSSSPIYRT